MPALFDSKVFNPEVFATYVDRVPRERTNAFLNSGALGVDQTIAGLFTDQVGGNYATIPFKGLIGRSTQNYDGSTDITANTSETYSQGVVVVGRADAWTERDFSYDIAGHTDFMSNVAAQVAQYWEDVDQDTLLSILEGIFKMTGTFPAKHTYDISADAEPKINQTTLNTAIQKASGDMKQNFALAIMHSIVSTNLENMNLIQNLKYTDTQGIQRDLTLGTWNGRTVIVDDNMPNVDGKYTTYLLGRSAFVMTDCGARVPYEMDRNPAKYGGMDTLYSRQRKIFRPYGISFTKSSMSGLSPTDAELRNGANWDLVNNGKTGSAKKYITDKAIPIARIISQEEPAPTPTP